MISPLSTFIKDGSGVTVVRLLRLLRLLSLLKTSEQLRVIVVGLVQGLKSSVYIVFLLLLVTYMFSVIGTSREATLGL